MRHVCYIFRETRSHLSNCQITVGVESYEIVTFQAHFDGRQILLDEPYELAPNTKLVVSVIQMQSDEPEDWTRFSLANLERAYGNDEPEYSLELIKEANPKYE
jgi:hypothetical protein